MVAALCALLWAAAAPGTQRLIHNVNGYTPTVQGIYVFDALLVEDGRVRTAGRLQALAQLAPEAERHDGRGCTLLPGLIDAHAHLMSYALESLQADLRGSPSLEDALARVRAFAQARTDLAWITGHSWNQVLWTPQRFPTAAELDRAVADRPVWLRRIDGHAGWANSAALRLAGVRDDTPDPPGGQILRDAQGRATGVLIDAAMGLVNRIVPAPDARTRRAALKDALARLSALGLTAVHDAGAGGDTLALLEDFAQRGALPLRVYAMLDPDDREYPRWLESGPRPGGYDDRLSVRSVKLYADGALGSRGAALLADYADQPGHRGLLFRDADGLYGWVLVAARAGFQVNVHAIGDAANRQVLEVFSRLPEAYSPARLRHRIEHAQVVAVQDIPRFAELGVIASMQPTHATSDMKMADQRLGAGVRQGEARLAGAYAWRRMLDAGVRLAGGSDFPVELPDPVLGLFAAVTRTDVQGRPEGGWLPDQRLSRAEALRAFTLDAAYAAHWEDRLGSLEPGKWADFVLLDRDYFEIPAAEIHGLRVVETWVAGERVHADAETRCGAGVRG